MNTMSRGPSLVMLTQTGMATRLLCSLFTHPLPSLKLQRFTNTMMGQCDSNSGLSSHHNGPMLYEGLMQYHRRFTAMGGVSSYHWREQYEGFIPSFTKLRPALMIPTVQQVSIPSAACVWFKHTLKRASADLSEHSNQESYCIGPS